MVRSFREVPPAVRGRVIAVFNSPCFHSSLLKNPLCGGSTGYEYRIGVFGTCPPNMGRPFFNRLIGHVGGRDTRPGQRRGVYGKRTR